MPPNDGLKRYIEAGLALSQITRARAEEVVHDLIQAGELETTRAQEWVEDLVKASRERSDVLLSTVRKEVRAQLAELGISNVDDLARRVAAVLERAETAARKATSGRAGRARGAATKAAAKKTTTKAAAKKTTTKAAAKKTTTKAAAKKTTTRAATTAAAKKTTKAAGAAKARR